MGCCESKEKKHENLISDENSQYGHRPPPSTLSHYDPAPDPRRQPVHHHQPGPKPNFYPESHQQNEPINLQKHKYQKRNSRDPVQNHPKNFGSVQNSRANSDLVPLEKHDGNVHSSPESGHHRPGDSRIEKNPPQSLLSSNIGKFTYNSTSMHHHHMTSGSSSTSSSTLKTLPSLPGSTFNSSSTHTSSGNQQWMESGSKSRSNLEGHILSLSGSNLADPLMKQLDTQLQEGVDLALKQHKAMMTSLLEAHFLTEMEIKDHHDRYLTLVTQAFVQSVEPTIKNCAHPNVHSTFHAKRVELDNLVQSQFPFYVRKHEIFMDNLTKKAKECTNAADCLYEDTMENFLNPRDSSQTNHNHSMKNGVNLNKFHSESNRLATEEFHRLILEVGLEQPRLWQFELNAKIKERFSEYLTQYPAPDDPDPQRPQQFRPDPSDRAFGPVDDDDDVDEEDKGHHDNNSSDSGDNSDYWPGGSNESVDSIGRQNSKSDGQSRKTNQQLQHIPNLPNMLVAVKINNPRLNFSNSMKPAISTDSVDEDTGDRIRRSMPLLPREEGQKISKNLTETSNSSVDIVATVTGVPAVGKNREKPRPKQTEKFSVTTPNDDDAVPIFPKKSRPKQQPAPGYSVVDKGPLQGNRKAQNLINPKTFFPQKRSSSSPAGKIPPSNSITPITQQSSGQTARPNGGGLSATYITAGKPTQV